MKNKLTFVFLFLFSLVCKADLSHHLIRRVVVFPFASDSQQKAEALESWWKVRETLTQGKQFLVASKDFLERKDVFQPRVEMSPADVIILSELLDAQMILTGILQDKKLTLSAYEAQRGQLIWKQNLDMHPSLPLKDQIEKTSVQIAKDLIASFPYHGFVFKEEMKNHVVSQKNGKWLTQVAYSTDISLSPGDDVQWFHLYSQNLKPLFQGGATLEIYAEGKVIEANPGVATVEIVRATDVKLIKELSLVRFPVELRRIKEDYALKDSIKRRINPDYFSPDIDELKLEEEEAKPLATALSFLINAATILLLAF